MKHKLKITFEGSHVLILSDGDKSYETAHKLWSQTVDLCEKHQCFKVLGIANSTKIFSPTEAFDHEKLFKDLGINYRFRIAWVELNPEARATIVFIETVLKNRGLPGRAFSNVEEAKTWLFDSD